MTLRQLPGFAFRSPTDYANEMDRLHGIYDATLGTGLVDLLERLQLFRVFSSIWFTRRPRRPDPLDRRLHHRPPAAAVAPVGRHPGRPARPVLRPDPAGSRRAGRRLGADAAAAVLRRHRFVVRREAADGATYLYGDRHRWTKMATLLTHTGLVLFLVAAAVTSRLGDEQGLVVAEGDSLTVQPIGTPGLLLVRNLGFDAPGFDTGRPTDFTTHLAVYQDGKQVADKVIRVNDPLDDRRLHVPPERVRAGARRRHPRPGRQAAVDGADPDDRLGGRLPVRGVRRPGPRRRAAAAPPAGDRRHGDPPRPAVPAGRARTRTARPTSSAWSRSRWRAASRRRPPGPTSRSSCAASPTTRC